MKKNNITIVVIILLLLGIGLGMNYVWERGEISLDEDGNPTPNITTPVPTAGAVPNAPSQAPTPPAAAQQYNGPIEPLPVDLHLGSKKAKTVVEVAYLYTASERGNLSLATAVVNALKTWSKSHPNVAVKIVAIDRAAANGASSADIDAPMGLSINRTSVSGLDQGLGQPDLTPDKIISALAYVN